jgi:hypothetical protein
LQAFYHGHCDAIIGQYIGEFDADRTQSDDGDRRRQLAGHGLFLVVRTLGSRLVPGSSRGAAPVAMITASKLIWVSMS